MSTIATHSCQHFQRLCIEEPVSRSLKNWTSPQYHGLLAALDLFERDNDLSLLRAALGDRWPFPSKGPKHDTTSPTFHRVVDEDIAAVFARLLPPLIPAETDHLQPESLNVLLLYNLLARRGLDVKTNSAKLHWAMQYLSPLFANNFNARWFISYCDTVCDSNIFDEHYRLRAATTSATLNGLKITMSILKIAETRGPGFLSQLIEADQERLSLGHGMMTYWFKGGDAMANHLERSSRMVGETGLIGIYFHYSLNVLLFNNTSKSSLSDILAVSSNILHISKMNTIRQPCEHSLIKMEAIKLGLQAPLEDPAGESMDAYIGRALLSQTDAIDS